jgi:hypothetical protein
MTYPEKRIDKTIASYAHSSLDNNSGDNVGESM